MALNDDQRLTADPANTKRCHSITFFQTFWRGHIPHRRAINLFGEVSVAFYCQMIIGLLLTPRVRLEENLTGH